MAESVSRRGGAPTQSEVLVNVDQVTIVGDGSIDFPLRGVGGDGAPTAEHLSGDGSDPIAMDPSVGTSFLANTESESSQVFTLPDGTVDGQVHRIVNVSTVISVDVVVTPANLGGGTSLTTSTNNASAELIWNDDDGEWRVAGTMLGFSLA